MNVRLMLAGIAALAMSSCALMDTGKQQRALLLNPQRANATPDNRPADNASRAFAAQEVMVKAYYKSMALAQTDYDAVPVRRATPETIADYVNEGIALNTAFCRRWFTRVDNTQRQYDWSARDVNIITALGTTLLGAAEASAKTVALYGAGITAGAGLADNFNSALLTAPSQKNVEQKIMAMLNTYAVRLREEARSMTFAEAFTRLETHADICTFATIRDVVNTSLTQTEQHVDSTGGIQTRPSAAARAAIMASVAPPAAVTSAYVKDDSGERIAHYWAPADVVDQAHQDQIRAWMTAHGVNISIAFFAHARLYEAARKQLVADLAIPAVAP